MSAAFMLMALATVWWIFRRWIARRQYFAATLTMTAISKKILRVTWPVDPENLTEDDLRLIGKFEKMGAAFSILMFACGLALLASMVIVGNDWTGR